MDGHLRNALIYSVLPVVITLAGAMFAAFKPLPASGASAAQLFASGAVFAVIAVELLPDVVRAHSIGGLAGFALGVVAMIVTNWLSRRWERAGEENDRRLPSLLSGAVTSIPIAGLLIGGGFVAGFREGQLLTLVATVMALAVALALITALNKSGMRRGRLLLAAVAMAALIIAGAAAGARFMWGRSGADLDLGFAVCLAALLLRAMESLVESYEVHSSPWGLVIFFAGAILFLLLGRSLGAHPAHPDVGVNNQRSSFVTAMRPLTPAIRRSPCGSGGLAIENRFPVDKENTWDMSLPALRPAETRAAHAVLADGASHDEALAAIRRRITSGFKIAHVTIQVERRGCAEGETHL